jgi:hypothetical protein
MKNILVFPFVLFFFLSAFTQNNPFQSYRLNYYSDYQKLSDKVRDLSINFIPAAKDSCKRFGLDFSKFKDLHSATYFVRDDQDSLFESYVFEKLGEVRKLSSLGFTSTYKHNFSRFENLEALLILGKGGIGNTSISTLKFLTSVGIGDISGDEIFASDPIFHLKKVTDLNTGRFYPEPFPFEFIGQMEQLESILINGSDSMHIPESWENLHYLRTLDIFTPNLDEIPSFICNNLTELNIQSYNCPTLPACLLEKDNLKLSLKVYTTNKAEIKKIKKYKKKNVSQNKRFFYVTDSLPTL